MTAPSAIRGRALLVGAAVTCCTLGCWLALHPASLAAPVSRRLPRMIVPAAAQGEAELTMRSLDEYAALSPGPDMGADPSDTAAAFSHSADIAWAARDADTPPMAISPP